MIPQIKSEFKKLFTVRSTYVITLIVFAFVAFYAFYIEGLKAGDTVRNPAKLASEVTGAVGAVSIFGALVAVLLFAHEYRYNTIMYTLTSSNSRSKVLASKIIVISFYAIILTVLVSLFSPLMAYVGIHAKGLTLVPQTYHYWDLVWRSLYFGWATAMVGLLLVALIRNQIAAIVVLFLGPTTIEGLLTLLLKNNAVYLPFSSLSAVINPSTISHGRAAIVFSSYLITGWVVAWILFLRRDAN